MKARTGLGLLGLVAVIAAFVVWRRPDVRDVPVAEAGHAPFVLAESPAAESRPPQRTTKQSFPEVTSHAIARELIDVEPTHVDTPATPSGPELDDNSFEIEVPTSPPALQVGAGCRLEGQAFEEDGRPARDVRIWLMHADQPRERRRFLRHDEHAVVARAITDVSGCFAFEGMLPGIWYVGSAPVEDENAPAPVAQIVTVADGDTTKDVVLWIHRGLFIRGTVVDPAGEPVAGAYVNESWVGAFASSGDSGTFSLGPLVPGKYRLVARGGHGRGLCASEPVPASAGQQGVLVALRASGSISGTVLGPDGAPARAEVSLIPLDPGEAGFGISSIGGGRHAFRFDELVPGTYVVRGVDESGRVGILGDVPVGAGLETSGLLLRLEPGVRLRITVEGAEASACYYRVMEGGIPVAFGSPGGEPLYVEHGPIGVELWTFDTITKEARLVELRQLEAVAGQVNEVVFRLGE